MSSKFFASKDPQARLQWIESARLGNLGDVNKLLHLMEQPGSEDVKFAAIKKLREVTTAKKKVADALIAIAKSRQAIKFRVAAFDSLGAFTEHLDIDHLDWLSVFSATGEGVELTMASTRLYVHALQGYEQDVHWRRLFFSLIQVSDEQLARVACHLAPEDLELLTSLGMGHQLLWVDSRGRDGGLPASTELEVQGLVRLLTNGANDSIISAAAIALGADGFGHAIKAPSLARIVETALRVKTQRLQASINSHAANMAARSLGVCGVSAKPHLPLLLSAHESDVDSDLSRFCGISLAKLLGAGVRPVASKISGFVGSPSGNPTVDLMGILLTSRHKEVVESALLACASDHKAFDACRPRIRHLKTNGATAEIQELAGKVFPSPAKKK